MIDGMREEVNYKDAAHPNILPDKDIFYKLNFKKVSVPAREPGLELPRAARSSSSDLHK